jgi:hypothetical protein
MNARQTSIEELCSIAKDFMKTASEVRSTLEIMQASYNTVIDSSNVSSKEKETLKRIVKQVSPAGLNSLLDAFDLSVQRTRTLYTREYERAASALASTILEQAGVAGPTGERTFNSKADGERAAVLEVPKPKEQQPTTPPQAKSNTPSTYSKYTELRGQYPILSELSKKPTTSPIHQWVRECGYVMNSQQQARQTLDKGMGALLWPVGSRTNTVSTVQTLPHPCGKGTVYIIQMEKPTTRELGSHLCIEHHAVWLPSKHTHHVIVEVSSDPEQISRDCPFSRKRRGWEAIYAELAKLNSHDESTRPTNQPSNTNNTKQQPKASILQPAIAR